MRFLIPALILLTGAILQGQNLVPNGDFENGFSDWSNLSGGTSVAAYSLETASPYQAGTFWIDNISVVPTASLPITLTINPEIRHQEMVGFGGSLTWYRERALTSRHSAAIKQLLFEDLGLDLIRFKNWYYPNDYPTNKSASDPATKQLHDEAKAANPAVKTLLCSWSPPVSLKSNGSLNNGGTLASDANGYRYTDFAQYWVDALDRLGWNPDYLSFQNEPGYVATWKSCIFRPTQTPVHAGYAEASDAIYHAIKDRPNAPIMIGAEVESIGSATWSDWKNGAQVNRFREMNTPLLSRPYIGAHAYHTYNMQNESQIDGAIPLLNMIRDEFSDRPNFMTEYSNNNYDWLAAARVVHNTVVEANASAYFYWTLVWEKSASSMIGISSDGEYTVGPHYHMLKHYSKHVSIGHRRIEVSGSTSDVKISGFINPDETEITLVVINNSTAAQNVELVQTSLPVRSTVAYQSVVDHYFQNIGAIDLAGPQTLPAKSMTTYVVSLPPNRTWTGASGTAWDVNNSANWLEGDQKFYQFDKVTFGDTGAGTVAVTGVLTPGSVTVNSASNYNFTAAAGNHIAGAGSLTKSGSGTLNLTGAHAYTGDTSIRQGILNLGGETASGSIASTSPLVMAGGTLAYTTTGSQTQTFAGTSISSGASTLSAVTGNVLNLAAITRTAGATVNLDRTSGGGTIQGSATLTNDILRWATVSNTGTSAANSNAGFTFGTLSGGNVVAYTAATSVTGLNWTSSATLNVDITGSGGTTMGQSRSANSIRYVGTANYAPSISNASLTLNAVMNASTSSFTLNASGTGSVGIGTSNELLVSAAAGNITIAKAITGASGSLTKTGANTLTLSGANTYGGTTGKTNINAGTLLATNAGALPGYDLASRVSVASGATLAVRAGAVSGEWTSAEIDSVLGATTAAFASGSNLGIDVTTGNSFSYASDIGATQTAKGLVKSGAGPLTLANTNTYTGPTTISGGTLLINGSSSAASAVAVNTGALGGTGSVLGPVTVAATGSLAPGLTTGTTTGTLTVASADLSAGGTLAMQVNDASTPVSDLLAVTGTLNVTGAKLAISATGTPAAASYTLASATAITGTIAPGDITGLPAGYTVQQTATSITLVASTNTYANWLSINSPATGFVTDSDNDGVPNGVENVLGTNPNASSAGLTEISATASTATFKHTRNPTIASDVSYTYEWSTDLTEWKASGATNTGTTTATITPSAPVSGVVTVTTAITSGPATKLFTRIKASQP